MTAEEIGGAPFAADDTQGPDAEKTARHIAVHLNGHAVHTTMSAIATADVDELETKASAVGLAQVAGTANVSASVVPLLIGKQDVSFKQGYASAVIASREVRVKQGGAPIIAGRSINVDQGGGIVLVGGEVNVKNGFAGVVLSRKTTLSEDSRVLLGTKSAVIIAIALLGGFALVALVMAFGVKRVVTWRPSFSMPEMPDWEGLQEKLRRFQSAHARKG